jgi:hypothetical protein
MGLGGSVQVLAPWWRSSCLPSGNICHRAFNSSNPSALALLVVQDPALPPMPHPSLAQASGGDPAG